MKSELYSHCYLYEFTSMYYTLVLLVATLLYTPVVTSTPQEALDSAEKIAHIIYQLRETPHAYWQDYIQLSPKERTLVCDAYQKYKPAYYGNEQFLIPARYCRSSEDLSDALEQNEPICLSLTTQPFAQFREPLGRTQVYFPLPELNEIAKVSHLIISLSMSGVRSDFVYQILENCPMPNLQKLYLTFCKLDHLPEAYREMKNLHEFHAYYSNLPMIRPEILSNCSQLKVVKILFSTKA